MEAVSRSHLMTEKRLLEVLESFRKLRMAVIGDACLDAYWYADMRRSELSRETPHYNRPVYREEYSCGAAGNVAVNLATLNVESVLIFTILGKDWRSEILLDILKKRIEAGGCLVAASAAALTVGRFTLPVYEIYKVGNDLHWVEGMDILGHFGFNLLVIPHWNNAEGGTHDTRFCYMGEPRFHKHESLLPEDVYILGLDEHTACIIDLEKEEVCIKGIGHVTLHKQDTEMTFEKSTVYLFQKYIDPQIFLID